MTLLNIVVPDGSMQKVVIELLRKAGINLVFDDERTKIARVDADWIEAVVFQRPQEIPHLLHEGYFDLAITGEDWIANWNYQFPVLARLPLGRSGCKPVRIVLAVKAECGIAQVSDLPSNCQVATEYVQLAERFFVSSNRPDIRVVNSFGNTEHKVRYGAAGVIDVSESGRSLRANGLEVVYQLMESHTVLVANADSFDSSKRQLIQRFSSLLTAAYELVQSEFALTDAELDEISEEVGRGGGHAWSFRFAAAVKRIRRAK